MTPSYKAYEVAKATRDRFNEQYEVLNRSFGLEEGLDRKDDETQFIVANEELYAPLPPLVSRKNVRQQSMLAARQSLLNAVPVEDDGASQLERRQRQEETVEDIIVRFEQKKEAILASMSKPSSHWAQYHPNLHCRTKVFSRTLKNTMRNYFPEKATVRTKSIWNSLYPLGNVNSLPPGSLMMIFLPSHLFLRLLLFLLLLLKMNIY